MNRRSFRPLADLATRTSHGFIPRPTSSLSSSLAIASRNYGYFCQSRRVGIFQNKFLDSTTTTTTQQRATYSSTSTMLLSSPFRLNSASSKQNHIQKKDNTYTDHELTEEHELNNEEQEAEGYYSPHKPKRQWPPDMSKLPPKHQLRLERKYRRHAALKYARPRWVKATKLAQWGIIIFIVIYSVLFMEWAKEGEVHPFEGFRKDFFASLNSLFSTPQPPRRKE